MPKKVEINRKMALVKSNPIKKETIFNTVRIRPNVISSLYNASLFLEPLIF